MVSMKQFCPKIVESLVEKLAEHSVKTDQDLPYLISEAINEFHWGKGLRANIISTKELTEGKRVKLFFRLYGDLPAKVFTDMSNLNLTQATYFNYVIALYLKKHANY